jgi:hypothetical protein
MTRMPTYDELLTIRFFASAVDKRMETIRISPDEILEGKELKSKKHIHDLIAEGWLDEVAPDKIRVSKQTWDNLKTVEDLVGRMA